MGRSWPCDTHSMMSRLAFEARVIRACEAQKRREAEDDFIEFKRAWPDPVKSARQLAGACNSARGELVIWIIGDPSSQDFVGDSRDPADWWAGVKACFNELAPDLALHVVVHLPWGGAVVGLAFETSGAPYLVNNPSGGSPEREIPVRDATGTRSARRSELVSMMSPSLATARMIVTTGEVSLREARDGTQVIGGSVNVLLAPVGSESIFLPSIWTYASLSPASGTWIELRAFVSDPSPGFGVFRTTRQGPAASHPHNPHGVNFVPGGISLTGPGLVRFRISKELSDEQVDTSKEIQVRLQLRVLPSERMIEARSSLLPKNVISPEDAAVRTLGVWAAAETAESTWTVA